MWIPENPSLLIHHHSERKSLKWLHQEHGGSVDKIRTYLKTVDKWIPYKKGKVDIDESLVISMYKDDYSKELIAEKFSCSVGPIVDILNNKGIRKPSWAKSVPYSTYVELSDPVKFEEKLSELITFTKMATYYNVGYDMIASLCKKHNISHHHSSGELRSIVNRLNRKGSPVTAENFKNLHLRKNMSIQDISHDMGISVGYLRTHIKKWGIVTRDTRLSLEMRELMAMSDKEILSIIQSNTLKELSNRFKSCSETISNLLKKRNIKLPQRFVSMGERSIQDFLTHNDVAFIANDRKLIYPQEIDILIPELKIAIEYCGLYWHSELHNRGKDYHLNKLNMCKDKGYKLITIFEDEYVNNQELIHTKLASILKFSNGIKISARNCVVRPIEYNEKKTFLDNNHLQGNDVSKVKLGLFNDEVLVAVMTFAAPSMVRSSNKYTSGSGIWELNRYATDNKYTVRGGAGKLLKYFQNNYNWDYIYSYADKRWSTGDMYRTLNFETEKDSPPNYWYTPKGYYKREYRYKYAKYKLVEQGFDSSMTEREIMKSRGYTRIWDCGHHKFFLTNTNK